MTERIEGSSDHAETSIFIYYTIPPEHGPALMDALRVLVGQLPPGHACALMRRTDTRADGLETWMEVHGPFSGGDHDLRLAMIEDLAQRSGVTALAGGRRVLERFERVPGLNRCA